MCNFSTNDVLIIAKTIVEEPVEYFDSDSSSHYFCNYCEAELGALYNNIEDFKHELTCPVLIAQDILTGF